MQGHNGVNPMNKLTPLQATASTRLAADALPDATHHNLRNGYPDATAGGICNAVFDSDGFTASEGAGFVTFIRADAPSGKQCSVTYQAAGEASSAATITDLDISGC